MEIKQVNDASPERIFINFKAVDATTVTLGMAICYLGGIAADVASADGIQATASTVARSITFAGIAAANVAVNGTGRAQCWGQCDSILLSQETDKTIGPVGALIAGPAGGMISSTLQNVSTVLYKYVMPTVTTNISSSLPYGKGFVRAI